MRDEPEPWPEPRVTSNAILLSGYIAGALSAHRERDYKAVSFDPEAGAVIVQRTDTGNRFRIRVEQISGTEWAYEWDI